MMGPNTLGRWWPTFKNVFVFLGQNPTGNENTLEYNLHQKSVQVTNANMMYQCKTRTMHLCTPAPGGRKWHCQLTEVICIHSLRGTTSSSARGASVRPTVLLEYPKCHFMSQTSWVFRF